MRTTSRFVFLLSSVLLLPGCHETTGVIELGQATGCDTSQATCMVEHENTTVSLTLGPEVVPLKPFNSTVSIQGVNVAPNSVIVDFQMKGMDMGVNRYRLIEDGVKWEGKVTLPVCTASRMDWIALVEFNSNGKTYRAGFPFHTVAQH